MNRNQKADVQDEFQMDHQIGVGNLGEDRNFKNVVARPQDLQKEMDELDKQKRRIDYMNESQQYYETNMVAFKNNMSLLALNTFEVSRLVTNLNRENQ